MRIEFCQAGADTFTTAGRAQLGEPSKGPSSFDYYTRQPQRTRYDLVCQLPRGRQSTDDECAVAYKPIRNSADVKFPRDQALRNAWIRAVPRENLTVTENSRVCELHFMDEDIIRVATHTDQAMTVPLAHVRFRPDAVPSKFQNCPSYMSRKTTRREDPDSKRAHPRRHATIRANAHSVICDNQGPSQQRVAAFAGPKEIRVRLNRAYDLNLGDTPIVIYDIDLDDFEGKCPGGVQSPQIEAYATAPYDG
ncbi:hypothetical protein HPB52_021924 [Rhipicephalus sanguineus]|uniref:THAP-type domain-containing protein n=1 Tax=Rhipicephalus sanguineus TaxID=34632 RepID=A0A9D4QFJ1_RHISA|nr:hypothetical protein HPB52_021924 [Rhipicephalus sanguineus]